MIYEVSEAQALAFASPEGLNVKVIGIDFRICSRIASRIQAFFPTGGRQQLIAFVIEGPAQSTQDCVSSQCGGQFCSWILIEACKTFGAQDL